MNEGQAHLRDLEKEILLLKRENAELRDSLDRQRRESGADGDRDRAETIFRSLLEQARHLAGILDLDGVLRYANKTSRDFIGKDPSHLIGKKFWDTPWWSHSKKIQKQLRDAIRRAAKGEFVQFETMLSTADGSLRNLDFTLKPAYDEHGRIFCLIPEAWDITDRKKAEEALRESEEKYRTFIEATGTGYVVTDENGMVLDANPTYVKMTGHDRLEEIVNRSVVEWTLGRDKKKNSEAIRHCLEEGFTSGLEIDYVHVDGTIVSVEINSRAVDTGSGRNILALCRDVTERRKTSAELDRTHTLLDAVLGQSPVSIVVVSAPDLVVRYANRAAVEFLGLPDDFIFLGLPLHDALERRTWHELNPDGSPMDPGDTPLARALRGETTFNEESILVRGDGGRRWQLVNAAPVYDHAGELMAGVVAFADITERKRAEEALEKRILALTQPVEDSGGIAFEDLFNLPDIQRLQDILAKVWGVAALITRPDGTPITAPSNFTHFCADFVRRSPKGLANCAHSDSLIGTNPDGPNVQTCLSAGLCNAGASIIVGGRHVANWLIGQVRNETVDEKKLLEYARTVDADEDEFRKAYLSVPVMSPERFELVAEALFEVARQLSAAAYQNILQARFITERRRAEDALRESEEKFRSIFENAPVGIFRTNARGQALQINTAMALMLGFDTPADALKYYTDLGAQLYVHAERRAEFLRLIKENGSVNGFEYQARRFDGRSIWLSMNARIAKSENDGSFIIEGFASDITDRKLAEDALRESGEKLRAVLHGAPIPQFFIDGDHRVVHWNRAIEEYSGIPASEIVGTKDHWRAFYPSARPCLADLVLDGDKGGVENWYAGKYRQSKLIDNAYEAEDFFPALGKGGMWLFFTAALITDSNGAVIGALETLEDITERKLAEQALEESRERLASILRVAPVGIALAQNRTITEINRRFCEMTGYSEEELVGGNTRMLYPSQDEYEAAGEAVYTQLNETGTGATETRWIRKDGSLIDVFLAATFLNPQDASKGSIFTVLDITERKRAEEDLRATTEELDRYFTSSLDLLCIADTDGYFRRLNPEWERTLGYTLADLENTRFLDLVHPDDMDATLDAIRRLDSQETILNFENRYRCRDGSYRWIEWRSHPVGKLIYAAARDITERVRVEEALRISESNLSRAQAVAHIGSWYYDATSGALSWSDETYRIFGVPIGSPVSMELFLSCIHPNDRETVSAVWRGSFDKKVYDIEHRIVVGDSVRWVRERSEFMVDSSGKVTGSIGTVQDITERKLAEEALKASEGFLNTIIENSPFSTWISDSRGTMLRMNQACRDLLHVTDEDLVGRYNLFEDPITESQGFMPRIRDVFERAETARFVIYYDSSTLRPGTPAEPHNLILEVTISPVLDAEKRVIHAIVQHIDITERVRAEHEVEHRHEFERLITGISTRFINLDPGEIDHAINDSLRLVGEFTGADRCLLFLFRKGHGTADSTHEWCAKGIESHKGMLQNMRSDNFPYISSLLVRSEVVNVAKLSDFPPGHEMERRSFELAGVRSFMLVPIEFKKKVVGFLGLDAIYEERTWPPDIAALLKIAGEVFAGALERRQTEAALVMSEERFKRLVQNSNDIIAVLDEEGTLTSLSGPVGTLTGFAPEELTGRKGFDLVHPEDVESTRKIFREFLEHPNTPGRIEFRCRHKNGSWVTVEAVGNNLLGDPAIKGVVLNIRDISERNRLQDQLQQAMKMEAVGRLAGGVAHDFNNLLTSIICNVEVAGLGISQSDPLHQNLSEVEKAAQSAATLTRQLLAFSRKQIIEPKVLNLNDLVRNIQKMLVRLIGEDITFKTVLAEDLGSVRIDAGQFEQVLVNLAVNARDAMPDGGMLTIETFNIDLDEEYCALHPQAQPGRYVLLTVSDSGHGMTDEVKRHIFEPFYTTKALGQGTGLGLATTFGAVKQAGGSIEVYSEVGRGTTFKIFLPRTEEKASALVRETTPAEQLAGTETILVVEDEPGVREMAVKILKRYGYTLLSAPNGGEAFMLAEKHTGRIDLLMTDVVMPGMNGRELAERLVKLHPEMKVLYTSGYTENVIVHHGVIDKSLNFIGKPYSPQGLARKIRDVLGPAEKKA